MNIQIPFPDFSGGDLCSTGFLVLILTGLGSKMVDGKDALRRLGGSVAAASFLVLCGWGWFDRQPDIAADWLPIVFSALGLAGMVLGFCWIGLPVLALVYDSTIGAAVRTLSDWRAKWRQAWEEWRRRREEDARLRRQEEDDEWLAPERERARQEAEARARAEAEARRRREDARLQCEVYFNLHEPDLGNRFQRKLFEDYLKRYLGDDRPLEEVEQRAQRLLDVLRQALEQVKPPARIQGLADIQAWYDEQRRGIDAMPDSPSKRSLLARLNAKRAEFENRFMEEMEL